MLPGNDLVAGLICLLCNHGNQNRFPHTCNKLISTTNVCNPSSEWGRDRRFSGAFSPSTWSRCELWLSGKILPPRNRQTVNRGCQQMPSSGLNTLTVVCTCTGMFIDLHKHVYIHTWMLYPNFSFCEADMCNHDCLSNFILSNFTHS